MHHFVLIGCRKLINQRVNAPKAIHNIIEKLAVNYAAQVAKVYIHHLFRWCFCYSTCNLFCFLLMFFTLSINGKINIPSQKRVETLFNNISLNNRKAVIQ